jgi:putative colanic acid biosynthesis UDP-glucose lipid carrier transferase
MTTVQDIQVSRLRAARDDQEIRPRATQDVRIGRLRPGLLARLLSIGGAQRTAVIVGANEIGCQLRERIDADPWLGIQVAGFFDDCGSDRAGGNNREPLLGSLAQLASYVKAHQVDVTYIALPMCPEPHILKLLDELRDTTASVYFVPDVLMFDLIQTRVDTIGGIPVIAVCESPMYGINAMIKRASDIVLATLILVITAPLLLAVALGVKLSSPGPVLFRQRRYGLDGREIMVYKFRTMTCLEDGEVIRQATRDDARTTRFGAFLRRYSLDEFPQLVNVLQGRMSVVGPRPHAIAHNEIFRKRISGYMIRHKVKPGITGLAQVSGLRGETDTVEKMQARIESDLEYLRNWSIWLDLKIVARTVGVVLDGEGAW